MSAKVERLRVSWPSHRQLGHLAGEPGGEPEYRASAPHDQFLGTGLDLNSVIDG